MGRQRRGDVGVGGTQPIAHPTRPPSEDGMLASGPQPCKLTPGLQAAMGGLSPRAGSTAQDHQVSRTWFRKSSAASFGPVPFLLFSEEEQRTPRLQPLS